MAWIASNTKLIHSAKIINLARELGISRVTALGHFHAFLHSVLEQNEGGGISDFNPQNVSNFAAWEGDPLVFFEAIFASGVVGKNLIIDGWLDLAGRYIRQKYRNRKQIKLQQLVAKFANQGERCAPLGIFTEDCDLVRTNGEFERKSGMVRTKKQKNTISKKKATNNGELEEDLTEKIANLSGKVEWCAPLGKRKNTENERNIYRVNLVKLRSQDPDEDQQQQKKQDPDLEDQILDPIRDPQKRKNDTNIESQKLIVDPISKIEEKIPDLFFGKQILDPISDLKNQKNIRVEKFRTKIHDPILPKEKEKKKPFIPPTLEEVQEYATNRKSRVSPEKFIAHYDLKNWMYGKTKITHWRKAFTVWELNDANQKGFRGHGYGEATSRVSEASERRARKASGEYPERLEL